MVFCSKHVCGNERHRLKKNRVHSKYVRFRTDQNTTVLETHPPHYLFHNVCYHLCFLLPTMYVRRYSLGAPVQPSADSLFHDICYLSARMWRICVCMYAPLQLLIAEIVTRALPAKGLFEWHGCVC